MTTLSGYDWEEVFKYGANPEIACPGMTVDQSSFTLDDVARCYGHVQGDNDGPTCTAYGKLKDGRYFFISAGCDYTGWG